MAKFIVKLTRESYVEIEANDKEAAMTYVDNGNITDEQIEKGSENWDIDSIYPSEE